MTPETTSFLVNGESVTVKIDPETPLLYVLRGELGLKTARFGCGVGLCGACTVLIDGKPVQSCNEPLGAVKNLRVETVEGLAASRSHPLIDAVIEKQAAQCGYCLPGMIMSAKSLLDSNPSPTRTEIVAALDGNLCRCGAHQRILEAVELAAARISGMGQ